MAYMQHTCKYLWETKLKKHQAYMKELRLAEDRRRDTLSEWDKRLAYDMYEPEWVCELDTRVGPREVNVGDGPKFVCAPELLRENDCIVYSIGSNYNFEFEEGMHKHAPNCEFHVFDGTMDLTKRPLPAGLGQKNIHFHNWNVDARSKDHARWTIKGLEDILEELGHKGETIQVFKIDCEGCEYEVLPLLADLVRKGEVTIGQIQVEVHYTNATQIQNLFQTLRAPGFMIFHKERNHWGCNGYSCVEYSLVSFEVANHVFLKTHCPHVPILNVPAYDLESSGNDQRQAESFGPEERMADRLDPGTRNKSPLAYWESEACQRFLKMSHLEKNGVGGMHSNVSRFDSRSNELDEKENRLRIPMPIVSEDLYESGRQNSNQPPHAANEVVISDEWKFVYVEVRKTASSTIRQALSNMFNVTFNKCPVERSILKRCRVLGGRCSTLCLNETHIQEYFFFSFVRDPEERFFSGYKEAFNQRFSKIGIKPGNVSHMLKVIDLMQSQHYYTDHHLESQSMSLSSPWIDGDGVMHRIPMDFIGRVETLSDDFEEVLRSLENREGRRIKRIKLGFENPGGEIAEISRSLDNEQMSSSIKHAYLQDFICFGYG